MLLFALLYNSAVNIVGANFFSKKYGLSSKAPAQGVLNTNYL